MVPRLGDVEVRTVYDLLDVVRVRSGMWIGSPSATRLDAFVHGFQIGMEASGVALDEAVPPWSGFHGWVAQRLGLPLHVGLPTNGRGWCDMLLESCGGEAAAFERFWIELDDYRGSHSPTLQ